MDDQIRVTCTVGRKYTNALYRTRMDDPNFVLVPVPTHRSRRPRTLDVRTRSRIKDLLKVLRAPPKDYDGSNEKLAQYLGVSERQLIRILGRLKSEGVIKCEFTVRRLTDGTLFTERLMYINKEYV